MNSVFARIFASRKVWIALAAVAGCVITLLGADPAKWTPLISAIVALASVVIAAIGYEDGQEKSQAVVTAVAPPGAPPKEKSGVTLNSAIGLLLLPSAFCLLPFLGGCAAVPAPDYTAADRATYEAIAPEYSAYVAADPGLSDLQKTRRQRTAETWRLRLEQAERSQSASH